MQQHSPGAPAATSPPLADPAPWQQGQGWQKRSHLVSSEAAPLGKLLQRGFVSLMDEERAECGIRCQRSVFAHLIQLFSTLLNLPKQSCLWKVKEIYSTLHLPVHATEISPTE